MKSPISLQVCLAAALLHLAASSHMRAVTIEDNFNRTSDVTGVTSASDPNPVGSGYLVESGTWSVRGTNPSGTAGYLQADTSTGIMTQEKWKTVNTHRGYFILKADILCGGVGSGRWGGLVFNYQNASNYYFLRFVVNTSGGGDDSLQLGKVVNGTSSQIAIASNLNLTSGVYYTLKVQSSTTTPNTFTYSMANGATVLHANTATDAAFTDGYGGFYRSGGASVRFDNYKLESWDSAELDSDYDPFQRTGNVSGVTSATSPNPIGAKYAIEQGTWSIGGTSASGLEGYLQADTTTAIMIQNVLPLRNTGGGTFTAAANVMSGGAGSGRWGGIVFNYQNANNYYFLRFVVNTSGGGDDSLQLGKVVNGTSSQIAFVSNLNLESNTYYTLTVQSSTTMANTFTYTIGIGTSETYKNTVTDSTFANGYFGFYRSGGTPFRFKEFWASSYPDAESRGYNAKLVMEKATEFMSSISTSGGYVWRYALDLSERAGESVCPANVIWMQSPGTGAMGLAFIRAWEASGNPKILEASRNVVGALADCQLGSGGWHYSGSYNPAIPNEDGALDYKGVAFHAANPTKVILPLYFMKTTFDDDTTQNCVRFLIEHVAATESLADSADDLAGDVLEAALDGMLAAQYPNGAWPQRYDGSPRDPEDYPIIEAEITDDWLRDYPTVDIGRYTNYYTNNDAVMRDCIRTMLDASSMLGRSECLDAAKDGGDFLILSQFPQPQSGWAQQYDFAMIPAWARAWEVPGVASQETRMAMEGLMDLYLATGNEDYKAPIPAGISWLQNSTIGTNLWARIYEMETNDPIYAEDGEIQYTIPSGNGYAWQGSYLIPEFIAQYNLLVSLGRAGYIAAKAPQLLTGDSLRKLINRVDRVTAQLDDEHRWVRVGLISEQTSTQSIPIIDTAIFIQYIDYLTRYLHEVALTVLPAPAQLSAIPAGFRVNLSWSAVSGATGYKVARSTVSGGPYSVIVNGLGAASYGDTVPAAGTYFYVALAVNAAGDSPYSNQVNATVAPPLAASPLPTAAVSRKAHGSAGSFDILLAVAAGTTSPAGPLPVECRTAEVVTLIVTFDKEIISGQALVGMGSAVIAGNPTFQGNQMTINLTNLGDLQTVKINLNNVQATDGGKLDKGVAAFRMILGDVNGDGTVSTSDVNLTRAAVGAVVTGQNFRSDAKPDGSVSVSDVNTVRAAVGHASP